MQTQIRGGGLTTAYNRAREYMMTEAHALAGGGMRTVAEVAGR
jgi:hypothetical protein